MANVGIYTIHGSYGYWDNDGLIVRYQKNPTMVPKLNHINHIQAYSTMTS